MTHIEEIRDDLETLNHKTCAERSRSITVQTMINEKYKYSELTSKIIACAMTVHKALGNGFQEVIYQRALEIEMQLTGINFCREYEMPVFYRETQIIIIK